MTATVTKLGYSLIIVGTNTEVLQVLVNENFPKVRGFFYNTADSKYHILAVRNP